MKGHSHAVADTKASHVASNFDYCAPKFVAGHSGEGHFDSEPSPVVLPQVPITAANSACLGLNNRVGWSRRGIWEILNF